MSIGRNIVEIGAKLDPCGLRKVETESMLILHSAAVQNMGFG